MAEQHCYVLDYLHVWAGFAALRLSCFLSSNILSVSNLLSLHFSHFLCLTQTFNASSNSPLSKALILAAMQSVLQAQRSRHSAHTAIKTRPHTLATKEDEVSLLRRLPLEM